MITKKFTVNGKDYATKNIDFNGICELEDLGLSITDLNKNRMSAIRALFAYHSGLDSEDAGVEIMEHLKNGGGNEFFTPLIDSLLESDFFRATQQSSKAEETATSESKTEQ